MPEQSGPHTGPVTHLLAVPTSLAARAKTNPRLAKGQPRAIGGVVGGEDTVGGVKVLDAPFQVQWHHRVARNELG